MEQIVMAIIATLGLGGIAIALVTMHRISHLTILVNSRVTELIDQTEKASELAVRFAERAERVAEDRAERAERMVQESQNASDERT